MKQKGLSQRLIKETISFLKMVVISFIVVNVVTTFFVKPVKVLGASMYPTLHHQDQGLSSVIQKVAQGIKRFDIVVVYLPSEEKYIVKRVIGLPNETISFIDEQLYINEQAITEGFLNETYVATTKAELNYFTKDVTAVTLKNNEYFLMGDNRPYSLDSRYYGPFKVDQIISIGLFWRFPLH